MLIYYMGTGTYFSSNDNVQVMYEDEVDNAIEKEGYETVDEVFNEQGRPFHNMWIIISGTVLDGFTHIGPFWDYHRAVDWAKTKVTHTEWAVTSLEYYG
jgi:hypothetical protein